MSLCLTFAILSKFLPSYLLIIQTTITLMFYVFTASFTFLFSIFLCRNGVMLFFLIIYEGIHLLCVSGVCLFHRSLVLFLSYYSLFDLSGHVISSHSSHLQNVNMKMAIAG